MIQHVYPLNDNKKHILKIYQIVGGKNACKCLCIPRIEEQCNGNTIVIHNSFDGREGVEWAKEILK